MSEEIADGLVDEESLEIYLDVMDDNQKVVEPRPRTKPQYAAGVDWVAYYAHLADQRQYDAGVGEIPPPTITVVDSRLEPEETGLGGGLAKTIRAVRDARWPIVGVQYTRVDVGDALFANDADLKPGEEVPSHRRGDLKKAAHTVEHWWVTAAYPAARIGFWAHWVEGVTPKGARSFKWQEAVGSDPVGIPTELHANYEPNANLLKQQKEEPLWAHHQRAHLIQASGVRRAAQYNDGGQYRNTRPTFTGAKAFEQWLAEVIDLINRATGAHTPQKETA